MQDYTVYFIWKLLYMFWVVLSPIIRSTALHVLGSTITHHQERKQLHVQHLVFVAYVTHSTLKPVPTLPR
jgi:hypothetical protein